MKRAHLPESLPLTWLLLSVGCSAAGPAGSPPTEVGDEVGIDEYIRSLGDVVAQPGGVSEGGASTPSRNGDYLCTSVPVTETRLFDQVVAYSSTVANLWPGAILRGDAIARGQFIEVSLSRAEMVVSASLPSTHSSHSIAVPIPNRSSVRDAMATLVGDVSGATPAQIYAEIEQVHSDEQLTLALGAGTNLLGPIGDVSAGFDFSDADVRSRYLLKYVQIYYTVDVDAPRSPAAMLAAGAGLDEVVTKLPAGSAPVYVGGATYGRLIVFSFESKHSAAELGAALDFAYRGGVAVDANAKGRHRSVLNSSRMSAYILGGSGGDAARSLRSVESMIELIQSGGDTSPRSPGAPIAFQFRQMADNRPVSVSWSESYSASDCWRVSQQVLVTLDAFRPNLAGESDDQVELFGRVTARFGDHEVVLFDRDASHSVVLEEGVTWPGGGSPLAEAVLDVDPSANTSITLGVDLYDADWLSADDSLSAEDFDLAFETGWHRTVELRATGDDSEVEVMMTVRAL